MSNSPNAIWQARMQSVNARISGRFQTISQKTGMSFSSAFDSALGVNQGAETQTAQVKSTQGGINAETVLGLMQMGGGSDSLWGSDSSLSSLFGDGQSDSALSGLLGGTNSSWWLNNLLNATQNAGSSGTADSSVLSSEYDALIERISESYGVNPSLIKALIRAESGFNTDAVSPAGAKGLMQLMPATCTQYGVLNPHDPEENIEGGVRALLSHILTYDGDIQTALAAYNCGAGTLQKLGVTDAGDKAQFQKLPSETQAYILKIYGYLSAAGKGSVMTDSFFG
ncbi:lytic transglycosylase domain-containing protein [Oscillospiraceae bacterium OttesenSCG-928-F05]|nr:lytic transglycosylase domain-containing protein [Oscillospiraceae bacterium OttesenSCG-928-F05]